MSAARDRMRACLKPFQQFNPRSGDDHEPEVLRLYGPQREARCSYKPNNGRCEQAPRASHHEPEQRPKDLAAVERIHRQQVEDQDDDVDRQDRDEQSVRVRKRLSPPENRPAGPPRSETARARRSPMTSRDAPERGPGPLRRVHVGHATERPEHDLVGGAAHAPAGE